MNYYKCNEKWLDPSSNPKGKTHYSDTKGNKRTRKWRRTRGQADVALQRKLWSEWTQLLYPRGTYKINDITLWHHLCLQLNSLIYSDAVTQITNQFKINERVSTARLLKRIQRIFTSYYTKDSSNFYECFRVI